MVWRFDHPVPVYYQGCTFDLRVSTDCGPLIFVSDEGEINPGVEENDFANAGPGSADMTVQMVTACVAAHLGLTASARLTLQTMEGAVMGPSDLVTEEAQGESTTAEDD